MMKKLIIIPAILLLFISSLSVKGQANWVYSGAPIGDESINIYPMNSSTTLTLRHPFNEDSLSVYSMSGPSDGLHIYRVDQSPNVSCGLTNVGSNDRYFGVFVVNNGASPSYSLKYYYNSSPYVTPANEPDLELGERSTNADVTCPAWFQMPAFLDMTNDELTISGISGRREVILSTKPDPLPIELLSFNVVCDGQNTIVDWVTNSEVNNDYFTIESSLDGVTFNEIATVNGAGNSNVINTYRYVDEQNYHEEKVYYRLKQTDFNGDYEYFDWKVVSCGSAETISVYPNPAKDNFTININNTSSNVQLSIYNSIGQKLVEQIIHPENAKIYSNISTTGFSEGVYFVHVKSSSINETIKLFIQK